MGFDEQHKNDNRFMWLVGTLFALLAVAMFVSAADGDPSRAGNSTTATVWYGGTTGNVTALGNISAGGNIYSGGAAVCTASNGLCAAAGYVSSASGWTNTTITTKTTLNVTINGMLFRNTSGTLTSSATPTSAVDLVIGRTSSGAALGDFNDIALEYGSGGFKHYIVTKHHNVGEHNSNALLFYLNNATSATGSASPGTGNILAGGFFAGNGGSIGIKTTAPIANLDVNGSVRILDNNLTMGNSSASSTFLKFVKGNSLDSGVFFMLEDGTTQRGFVYMDSNENLLLKGDDIFFSTGSITNAMKIAETTGRVGIGTTAPTTLLDVNGTGNFSDGLIVSNEIKSSTYNGTGTDFRFNDVRITESSNINYFQSSADRTASSWQELRISPYQSTNWVARFDGAKNLWLIANLTVNDSLGIGTTVPTQKLDVNGSGNFSSLTSEVYVNGSKVCTAANGLCGTGAGNMTSQGTIGRLGFFSNATNLSNSVLNQTTAGNMTLLGNLSIPSGSIVDFRSRPARCPAGNNTFTVDWAGINQTCEQVNVSQFGFVANCPDGTVIQNITGSGLQCVVAGSASGNITGVGVTPAPNSAVAIWNNETHIAYARVYWNDSSKQLGINTPGAGDTLDVNGTGAFGGRVRFFDGVNVTSGPSILQSAAFNGAVNITAALNVSDNIYTAVLSCDQALETDAEGKIVCGTDESSAGGGGGNVTSVEANGTAATIAVYAGSNTSINGTQIWKANSTFIGTSSGQDSAIWGGGLGIIYGSSTQKLASTGGITFCIGGTHGANTCNSDRMIINGNGNVYMGASGLTPNQRLVVDGVLNVTSNLTVQPAGAIQFKNLSGTGNDYVCVDENGQLYRSDTACA